MFTRLRSRFRSHRRRAVVAVQVGVFLVVLLGFAALTVDLGAMYNTRADLQRSVDAAALAAAARLSEFADGDSVTVAKQAAADYIARNKVFGKTMALDPNTDIVFGRATFDSVTQQYDFVPTEVMPDAVQVRLRHTEDSPNGPVGLFFARIFGIDHTEMTTEAVAVMMPRDVAVVADLSASHTDDSEFRNYLSTNINLWEVWDSLPGGADEVGGMWNPANVLPGWVLGDEDIPQAAGPAWGYMQKMGWGTDPITTTYNPTSDAGLIRLAYNSNWSNAQLTTFLTERGYNATERSAIMSSSYDASGAYPYRVAVALGLAYWNSGIAGGLWSTRGAPPGNANSWIASNELEWTENIMGQSLAASDDIWVDYINNYMRGTSSELYDANSNFRYRYGAKTFTNYLLEKRMSNSQTPELAGTPTQPMQAVKESVKFLSDYLGELDTYDQLSLEVYDTLGRHEVDLTHEFHEIGDRLNEMQAGHYASYTNVGGGIQRAIEELTGPRARPTSRKVIFLLTDGNANVNSSGGTGDTVGGNAYATDRAAAAAALGIRIFAVSVGAEANQSLMTQIADIGVGEHFHAGGSIEQYSDELVEIFGRLGSKRPVELIR